MNTLEELLSDLFGFKDLGRVEIETATAGDIVGIAGFSDIQIGETICDPSNPEALPLITVDEPTLQMNFAVNDSPFAGLEGKFVTSRQIRKRLYIYYPFYFYGSLRQGFRFLF